MTNRRTLSQAATTSALSWTIFVQDDFDIPMITVTLDAAPTTAEDLTVTLDSHLGAGYDATLLTVDPIGKTEVVVRDLIGLRNGDKIVVAYTNTDGNSITGTATVDIYERCIKGEVTDEGQIECFLDGVLEQTCAVKSGDPAPVVIKSMTFANTTGAQTLFTVTGDVVARVFGICKTNVESAGACNIEVGIAGTTGAFLPTTDATTLEADEIWHDATVDAKIELDSVSAYRIVSAGADIILTPSAQLDSGAITWYLQWKKLSADGNVVAA